MKPMGFRHVKAVTSRCEAAPGLKDVVQGVLAPFLFDFWAGMAMACAIMRAQYQTLCNSSLFCSGLQGSSALTQSDASAALYRSYCMLTVLQNKSRAGSMNPVECLSRRQCIFSLRLLSDGQLNLCAGRAACPLICSVARGRDARWCQA